MRLVGCQYGSFLGLRAYPRTLCPLPVSCSACLSMAADARSPTITAAVKAAIQAACQAEQVENFTSAQRKKFVNALNGTDGLRGASYRKKILRQVQVYITKKRAAMLIGRSLALAMRDLRQPDTHFMKDISRVVLAGLLTIFEHIPFNPLFTDLRKVCQTVW